MKQDDLENRFTYHAPVGRDVPRYENIRAAGKEFARLIVSDCPEGREQSLAVTHIEEAVFWANAAIARSE